MNHRDSTLLQFSLGLVTTKFIDTKSVSREPGGYKCKTAIWDIYNLCALDVVICKKNFRGILMGLKPRRRKKSLSCLFAPPHPPSKSLSTTRKMKTFWYLTNSAIEPAITEKKREFHLFISMPYWSGGLVLMSSITRPKQWPATLSNSVNKGVLFPLINVLPHKTDRDW